MSSPPIGSFSVGGAAFAPGLSPLPSESVIARQSIQSDSADCLPREFISAFGFSSSTGLLLHLLLNPIDFALEFRRARLFFEIAYYTVTNIRVGVTQETM